MSRPLAAALALVVAAAVLGCKGQTEHDRSTPEGTVRAFFAAMSDKRIPQELPAFFTDDHEVEVWKLRCQHRGCAGGIVHELTVVEKFEYRAVLRVKYEILGHDRSRTLGGTVPVTLTREGKRWFIHQFGERRVLQRGKSDREADRSRAAADGGQL